MSNNIIKTNDGRIFYIGQDKSSDLQHWKYIKREKVNGKWRYYYHDDEAESKIRDASIASGNNAREADIKSKEAIERQHIINDIKEKLAGTDDPKAEEKLHKEYRTQRDAQKRAHEQSINAIQESVRLEYDAKALQKDLDNSFGSKVADVLNQASDTVDKGKNWLKGIISGGKNDEKITTSSSTSARKTDARDVAKAKSEAKAKYEAEKEKKKASGNNYAASKNKSKLGNTSTNTSSTSTTSTKKDARDVAKAKSDTEKTKQQATSEPWVSEEYKRELEYNSKKNRYK